MRLAIVNDYEIVVIGVAAALQPFADRVDVIEIAAGQITVSDVDVLLYDTFAQQQGGATPVAELATDSRRLIVFSWEESPEAVQASLAAGASGFVSKRSSALQLVEAVEQVHAGQKVAPPNVDLYTEETAAEAPHAGGVVGRWPGDELGLTPRESEILALICQGLSNNEITDRTFIGLNTVKTHIRALYRKIGVGSRTQAVVWGHQHGFTPDRSRSTCH